MSMNCFWQKVRMPVWFVLLVAFPIVGMTLLYAEAGPSVEVRIESIPSPNLAKNPSVETGGDGQPDHWKFETGQPNNFEIKWTEGGRTGNKSLWLKAKTGKMSGYWKQGIPVEPGRTYLFKGYYRLAGGRMLVWIAGEGTLPDKTKVVVDERFEALSSHGHWLEPVFLPPEALSGPDPNVWQPFQVKFKVPTPVRHLAFGVGIFFTPGEAWFDDLWAGLAEMDLVLQVEAKRDESIRRVLVRIVDNPSPVLDSGPLQDVRTFKETCKAQPVDGKYEVEIQLTSGKTVRQPYALSADAKAQ